MSWDAAVESVMLAAGCDRARAEAAVRANPHLGVVPPPDPDARRDASILEKTEQAEIVKLFRAHGFRVYSLSQARASKQTPGIPDLWVTRAARAMSPAIAFWWESKRQVGGERSTAQEEFAAECLAAGVGYGFGDRHHAASYLCSIGVRA